MEPVKRFSLDGPAAESSVETDALIASKLESQPSSQTTTTTIEGKQHALFSGNLHIYTSRDFSNIGLSKKQKIVVLIGILLLGFIIKQIAIDPFRTDKARWQHKKEFVDKAVETELADSLMNKEQIVEIEKAAEDFVRQEEGDNV
jgi:hypothetical protein